MQQYQAVEAIGCRYLFNGWLNERALCDHLDEHGVAPRAITEDDMRVLGSMVFGSSMDELPDRKGVSKVKVCVLLPQRAEIAAMLYSRQLEVMRDHDFVTWEHSLHIQCCVVCDPNRLACLLFVGTIL